MIYKDLTIHYINSDKSDRLVKYDLIRKQNNDFIVKVFDVQSGGLADPKIIIQIDEFEITYDSYRENHSSSGFQQSVRSEFPPSFEDYVERALQVHRNKLD